MPCKNQRTRHCQIQNIGKAFEDKSEQGQGGDTAVDQQPETGGDKIRLWASSTVCFDGHCHRLSNHKCRHGHKNKIKGGVGEFSACKNSNQEGTKNKYPRAVVLREGDLLFEVLFHLAQAYKKNIECARLM